MARKTAEEGGMDVAAMAAERTVQEAAQAAQAHGAGLSAQQRQAGQTQVLSNGAIPEVRLPPIGGAPRVGDDADPQGQIDRQLLDPSAVAPVVADATRRQPFRRAGSEAAREAEAMAAGEEGSGPKAERFFAVLETKNVLDKTNGHRTPMRAGKVISDKHYDVANLIRQGVKLKKVAAPAMGGDDALIAAMTE